MAQKVVGIITLVVAGIILVASIGQMLDTEAWMDAQNKWYLTLKDAILTILVPIVVAIFLVYLGYKLLTTPTGATAKTNGSATSKNETTAPSVERGGNDVPPSLATSQPK